MIDRVAVIADAERIMQSWYDRQPDTRGPIGKYCVFWAAATVSALRRHGFRATINAGSAFWPVATDEQGTLRFGYEFAWTLDTARTIAGGLLPETHAWAVIPPAHCPEGRGQLIDLTTRFVPSNARDNGLTVTLPVVDYVWCYIDDAPGGGIEYRVDPQACEIVFGILASKPSDPGLAFRILRQPTT